MPDMSEPVVQEVQSAPADEQVFNIFDMDATPPTEEPAVESAPEVKTEEVKTEVSQEKEPAKAESLQEVYEQRSRMAAEMLQLKRERDELRAAVEKEKETASDDLSLINELLGNGPETEEVKSKAELAALRKEVAEARAAAMEVKQSQEQRELMAWKSGVIGEISDVIKNVAHESDWVHLAATLNPKLSEQVFDAAKAYYEHTGQAPTDDLYAKIIRDTEKHIEQEFMSGIDEALARPGIRDKIAAKLGLAAKPKEAAAPAAKQESVDTATLDSSLDAEGLPVTVDGLSQDELMEHILKQSKGKLFVGE